MTAIEDQKRHQNRKRHDRGQTDPHLRFQRQPGRPASKTGDEIGRDRDDLREDSPRTVFCGCTVLIRFVSRRYFRRYRRRRRFGRVFGGIGGRLIVDSVPMGLVHRSATLNLALRARGLS